MQIDNLVQHISEAIALYEGYMKKDQKHPGKFISCPNTLAFRHKNPGNIRLWGKYPRVKGYVIFPTDDIGWASLYRQVERNINRNLTLREFFMGKLGVYGGYAPSADGNSPVKYAEFVSAYLRGFTPIVQGIDQVLVDLLSIDGVEDDVTEDELPEEIVSEA